MNEVWDWLGPRRGRRKMGVRWGGRGREGVYKQKEITGKKKGKMCAWDPYTVL